MAHIGLLLGAILVATASLSGTAAAQERQLGSDGDVKFSIPTQYRCGTIAPVTVTAPDPSLFTQDQARLQRLLGLIRIALGFECPTVSTIEVSGVARGRHVYSGIATAADEWRLASTQDTSTQPVRTERELVRDVQRQLNALGYDAGPDDGLMGSRTRNALSAFQRDQGLVINGVASPQLLERLRSVAAARQPGATVAGSTPRHSSDSPTTKRATNDHGEGGAQLAGASVREDGIRVHSSGRLIVPWPVSNTHSPEGQQYQALKRLLRHAAVAEQIGDMAPADHPAFFADIARDYLSPSEFQPFFCTPDEMRRGRGASDCMEIPEFIQTYAAAGGGGIDNAAEHPFLWWRGATEFERRRSMSEFAQSGLLEHFIASAPDMPVRLIYTVGLRLDRYDFDAGHFPVTVSGGAQAVKLPGSHSVAFDLAELAEPVSVSSAAAEPLLQRIPTPEDEFSELTLAVEVDITLQDPGHASQRPRWDAKVGSAEYFLDGEATQPLAAVIEEVTGQRAAAPLPGGAPLAGDTATDTVLRQFDLHREDGRIVVEFEGYGQPTPEAHEAISYLFASAARDFMEAATERLSPRVFPVLFSILNDDVRTQYFDCSSADRCRNRSTNSYFAGDNEFEARKTRNAFEEGVAPKLVAEAPSLPVPMRIYLDPRLGEYDFDNEGFGVRIFQEARPQIDPIGRMFNFQPIFDLVPDFIPMPPDSAEQLVNAADGDPVLRIDYDVLSFRRMDRIRMAMKVRPVAATLMTGADNDMIHFEQTYAGADQANGQGDAVHAFLGPEIAEWSAPQEPTAYPVLGVAPGMTLEAAMDALSQSFSEAEITVADRVLRAERGYCGYEGAEGGAEEDERGAICFVAGIKNQRVFRVALQQIVHPGQIRNLNDETRARFGAPDSRGDGDVPAGSMLREYFGWGEELGATRAMLGRPEIGLPVHEAEVDDIYVNPRVAVFTLRVDAPPASATRSAADVGPSPEATTSETSSPAPEVDDGMVSHGGVGQATPETTNGEAVDKELALLGIAPGQARAEAQSILEDRFGEDTLAQAEDGTLILERGTCRYAAVFDPAIETEAGSTCVIVVFGPDDAVRNIVVRNVVAGAYVDAYAAELEGSFGVPVDRVLTDNAPQTLILGWGRELAATAAELERDASAGQRLHALEARLTQANGVTLVTVRLDTDPAASGPVATNEGDAGAAPPPIEF